MAGEKITRTQSTDIFNYTKKYLIKVYEMKYEWKRYIPDSMFSV